MIAEKRRVPIWSAWERLGVTSGPGYDQCGQSEGAMKENEEDFDRELKSEQLDPKVVSRNDNFDGIAVVGKA